MKKRIAMIAMMASLVTTTAFAEGVKIDGSIKSAETKTILAPYSGVVGNYAVTAGDAVNMGDALFALRTEQVYADFDGTVTAVFAQPGDSAASVEERYGALAYIEQDVLYRAECTTTGGDSVTCITSPTANSERSCSSTEQTRRIASFGQYVARTASLAACSPLTAETLSSTPSSGI